ncbi:hypothetical protein CVT24_003695 [Panaeolus cyanescens]|uniref:Anaphase-promoting complex subunit 4 WD40 domain-containing protein n=1 Tax=Panaeolus cyanescens TaxID=181874 RepID=A0A409X7G2_9AGAR|nr:hypothetical protein CVT24_003695 [Panaeolus cyanescens]
MHPPHSRRLFALRSVLTRHIGIVNDLQFSPDGASLASLGTTLRLLNSKPSVSHEVCLWDVKSRKVLASFPIYYLESSLGIDTHNVFFSSLLFISRTQLLLGTTNGLLVQLDFGYFHNMRFNVRSLGNSSIEVCHLTRSPDATVFACSLDDDVIVFSIPKRSSVESMRVIQTIRSQGEKAGSVAILHWMASISPSALLIGQRKGCINIWDVQTATQLRHCRVPAIIGAGQVIYNEKHIAIYNTASFSTEVFTLDGGIKIRSVWQEDVSGPGLFLPLLHIAEQSCIVLGSHSGKAYIHYIAKEEPYEVLKTKDPYPILCLAVSYPWFWAKPR